MAFGLTSKSKEHDTLPPEVFESLLRKSRRDILGLKIMLYTAVILLVGGFLYYKNVLQSAQRNFRFEMQDTRHQLDTIMSERALDASSHLEGIMEKMNGTISRLDNQSPQAQQLIERVKEDSDDFMHSYRKYSENKAANLPPGFE
jgi:hypothetical protein